ncbi:hypothetical protein CERZMDRAFT_22838, partial [Cercospora zeae-maydis SCOH1-5]
AFTASVDDTIVATAIPRISEDFKSIEDIAWYGSAYFLTMGSFQLLYGTLYRLHSDRTVYLGALVSFVAGSTVSATARNSRSLIIGRALAGAGAAGIITGNFVIMANIIPLRQRPLYTSIVGMLVAMSSVAGPLLGGVITDHLGWRWCFWVSLPAAAAIAIVFVAVHRAHKPTVTPESWRRRLQRYDPVGTPVFLALAICFQIALQWGGAEYRWGSAQVVSLFVVSGVLLATFIGSQWYMGEDATLPPRIAKQRTMASGGFFMFCLGGAYYSAVYYLPLWFQAIRDASPSQSGILSVPLLISMVVSSILIAGAVTAAGYYTPFAILSPFLTSVGAGLLSSLQPGSSQAKIIGYQIILGTGTGIGLHQPFIAAQTVLSSSDTSTGIAFMMGSEMLGGSLFIAVAQKIFTSRLSALLLKAAPGIDAAAISKAGATQILSMVPQDRLAAVRQAYSTAVTDTFYLGTGLAAASLLGAVFMEWRSIKQ